MKIYKTKKGYFYKEYKSSVFKGLRYNGLYKKSKQFFTKDDIIKTKNFLRTKNIQDLELYNSKHICKHIYYHMGYKQKNCKNKNSPKNIFDK